MSEDRTAQARQMEQVRKRLADAVEEIRSAGRECRECHEQGERIGAEHGEPPMEFDCVTCKFQEPIAEDIVALLAASAAKDEEIARLRGEIERLNATSFKTTVTHGSHVVVEHVCVDGKTKPWSLEHCANCSVAALSESR